MYIIIPKNQKARLGEPIRIILKATSELPLTDHTVTQIHLICESDSTFTDKEDQEFYAHKYDAKKHGFVGIRRPLEFLISNFKIVLYKVSVYEYEKGWGKKLIEIEEFITKEEADKFVHDTNSKNTEKFAPDYYIQAEKNY